MGKSSNIDLTMKIPFCGMMECWNSEVSAINIPFFHSSKLGNVKVMLFAFVLTVIFLRSTAQDLVKVVDNPVITAVDVQVGAQRIDQYISLIKDKSVAIIANQTSMLGNTHLLDTLLSLGIKVKKVFSPEHGFRGDADAGANVKTMKDKKTGLPIISLYGKKNKPLPADLTDVDVIVFDLQDVGVRFYTYISTLHYVMEACAENKKQLIVLDRPNPNGFYVDGPVLEEKFKSYVGLHPVPIVYGMTVGEYAQMINGEGWLAKKIKCDLKVITIEGYDHIDLYELPVKPSPNLQTMIAVYLYPSLALFEGTVMSVGRGTDAPFMVIGHPTLNSVQYSFTPRSIPGASLDPPYKGQLCHGYDLKTFGDLYIKSIKTLYLYWLQGTYRDIPEKDKYFNNYFNQLVGNSTLQQQIKDGTPEAQIRKSWEPALGNFKVMRKKYLLYTDF